MSVLDSSLSRFGPRTVTKQVKTWEDALVIVRERWNEVNIKWRRLKEERQKTKKDDCAHNVDIFTINPNVGNKKLRTASCSKLEVRIEKVEGKGGDSSSRNVNLNSWKHSKERASLKESKKDKEVSCEIDSDKQKLFDEEELEYKVEEPSKDTMNEKAIMLYVERSVHSITEELRKLMMKRKAGEDLEIEFKEKKEG